MSSSSNSDALALLHQLSSNPQMVDQIQNVLSLLNANSNKNHAYGEDEEEDEQLRYSRTFSQQPSSSSLSSPAVTLGQHQPRPSARTGKTTTTAAGPRSGGSMTGTRGSTDHGLAAAPRSARGKEAGASGSAGQHEPLLARCRAAEEAADIWARRFRASEADVEQLTRDVRLLEEKLEDQRRRYTQLEEKREADLMNAQRILDATVRRQDDVHAEAVRQLIQSHQLQRTAERYAQAAQHKSRVGLAPAGAPLNIRNASSQTLKSSASQVKRERSDLEDATHSKYARAEKAVYTASESAFTPTSWKERSEQIPLKDDDSTLPPSRSYNAASARAKQSTQLAADAKSSQRGRTDSTAATTTGRRTTTTLKRRTPLTPSMTHADRVAARSSASRSPVPTDKRHSGAPSTSVLPTGSWKLDTPTPPALTGDDDRQSPRPVTTAAAMSRYQSQQDHKAEQPHAHTHHHADNATEETFVSHYAGAPTKSALSRPPQKGMASKVASARLPGPTVAETTRPISPPPQTSQTAAMNISTGAVSGTSSAVAGGPTRSPSPLNPKRGPLMARRFIFTGLKEEEIVRLQKAIETLADDAMALDAGQDAPPPFETTHIVLHGTPRSVKAMCGVVSSRWLVSPDYIYNSLKAGFWLDEYEEGGLRFFPSPLKCQRFLLTMDHDDIRGKLVQVIEYGGGEVVKGTSSASGVAQDVVVISCGDDLLRFATQIQS